CASGGCGASRASRAPSAGRRSCPRAAAQAGARRSAKAMRRWSGSVDAPPAWRAMARIVVRSAQGTRGGADDTITAASTSQTGAALRRPSLSLPYELQLGWRYTRAGRATRRNGFISFISGVSLAGIALGVAALIIVLSVMNGFQKEVRDRML